MKVPLPNLDDRRWLDLVDEARSLIPVFAPDWTDHNVHDPGLTLIELLAWIAEMDIYELNRITDGHKQKFLQLVGIKKESSSPSRTALSITLKEGAGPLRLKANTEFACQDSVGDEVRFRLLESVTLQDNELCEVQVKDAQGFHDLTAALLRGDPIALFGDRADPGTEFYLGFSKPFRFLRPVNIFWRLGGRADRENRLLLISEQHDQEKPCSRASDCCDPVLKPTLIDRHSCDVPPLNRVRLVWEVFAEVKGKQRWFPLDPSRRQVVDNTRSFTLDGSVMLRSPVAMTPRKLGQSQRWQYYVRCRLEAGSYDSPPVAQKIVMNAASAEQSVPATANLIVDAGTVVQGAEPSSGDVVGFTAEFSAYGHIIALEFVSPSDQIPGFRLLEYLAPTSTRAGKLMIEGAWLGLGNGQPYQVSNLPLSPPVHSTFNLYTQEGESWRRWDYVDDFFESSRRDAHFSLDYDDGKVIFGDGEHGRVPPPGASIFAVHSWTRAEKGNQDSGTAFSIVDSPLNRIITPNFDSVREKVKRITNSVEATGGGPAETLDHAIGRAIELMSATWRAVTLNDYEELAKKTPGARVARAVAKANLHSSFPCFKAIGVVTVIILPDMPSQRPYPSTGLLRDVTRYLGRRRIVGTRVEVVPPRYLEVKVRAMVKALPGISKSGVQQKVILSLNRFFHPLNGGPDGTGWPFGRDVYRSEVLQVIDEVAGVDHVLRLELIADGCEPQCSNVCLGPTWLVAAGDHEIEIQ